MLSYSLRQLRCHEENYPTHDLELAVVVNFQLVVHDQLEPSSLPHVQIQLGKDVIQAFVVRIDMNHIPK